MAVLRADGVGGALEIGCIEARFEGREELAAAPPEQVRPSYRRALAVARAARAATFELRTLVSLARLPGAPEERLAALAAVRSLHATFTQGHGSVDLADARALLEAAH